MKLYYVGHKKSLKLNSWLAVTNDQEKAEKLLGEISKATVIHEVTYGPDMKPEVADESN